MMHTYRSHSHIHAHMHTHKHTHKPEPSGEAFSGSGGVPTLARSLSLSVCGSSSSDVLLSGTSYFFSLFFLRISHMLSQPVPASSLKSCSSVSSCKAPTESLFSLKILNREGSTYHPVKKTYKRFYMATTSVWLKGQGTNHLEITCICSVLEKIITH